ncbi:hypothetical protein [Comamonas sp. JC664]|uniref:hypothetical protein n=1 Tax=Comamonas sp. JC664 TaxID=2801917 RepID=UPI00174C6D0D|nr:hypothetical protein [Comamonas sp. JC664]MBL0698960.1 hypothetical protein [Comamonas sp. JC664]GHG79785.1 hypothetical protein GCM10012319_31990 [Comamonas sp. KCTC 72670]
MYDALALQGAGVDTFLKDLSSLHWWLGVVVVGVAINLASPPIGALLSKSSLGVLAYWRQRSAAQSAAEQSRIAELRASEYNRVMAAVTVVQYHVRAASALVVAVLLFAVRLPPADDIVSDSAWPHDSFLRLATKPAAILLIMKALRQLVRADEIERSIQMATEPSSAE